MKSRFLLLAPVAIGGFFLAPLPGRAGTELDVNRLNDMDTAGCFTPNFKAVVHQYVDTKKNIILVTMDEKELNQKLPDLQKQATEAEAKVAVLQKELAEYDHTDDRDFSNLQKAMIDPGTKLEDQIAIAQAYVWAYPTSSHLAEAQLDLEQAQKKLADQKQAEADAEAARIAAHEQLLQRVQARALNLTEWKDFLRDMSQDEVLKYMGRPDAQNEDNWVYSADWTDDPATHQKVGLQIYFNAARVSSVAVYNHP